MRIGIDARFLGPEGKGLGRYTEELAVRIPTLAPEHRFVLFLRKENWHLVPEAANVEKVLAPFRWYSVREQLRLPGIVGRARLDLMHFPHFNVPLVLRTPFVVTIHDLILTHFPTERASTLEPLVYRAKHRAYELVIRSAVRRARRVLTVSEYSKREIVKQFRLSPSQVVVTYEAGEWSHATEHPAEHALGAAQRGLLHRPYFLYVGNAYPHKNLERLMEAHSLSRHTGGLDTQLVLVGREDYFYKRLRRYATAVYHGVRDTPIVFAGSVTDAELRWLYRHALAYAFPSLAEGFGLPPLEAMAHGTPVVASSASCIPEILGDAALYFDPVRIEDIARALLTVAEHGDVRDSLRARGTARVARYSWDALARTTLSVYTDAGVTHA